MFHKNMASRCKDIVEGTDIHIGSPHIKRIGQIGRLSGAMTLMTIFKNNFTVCHLIDNFKNNFTVCHLIIIIQIQINCFEKRNIIFT